MSHSRWAATPFLLAGAILAQTGSGTLRGTVTDATGARIAASSIRVTAVATGHVWHVLADRRGTFRLDGLPAGSYRIDAAAAGFGDAEAIEAVSIGMTRDLTVELVAAAVNQAVGVSAQASSISAQALDSASAIHQNVVTGRDLATLPLPARSFANIAFLAAGTEPVEPSDPTKARITAVSTGGSSGLNNELAVDGGDNSDDFIGGFLQNYSPEAIREFNVRTGQEDAETGGTTSGSVLMTTRSGSNEWHGSAAVYERAAALNARYPVENPAPNPKQPFSRQNYVGTLGGPIRHDSLWFFTSFEHVHENASIAYSSASMMQFEALARLADMGLIPGVTSIPVPNSVAVPFRDYLGLARLDWNASSRSQWHLRGSNDEYTTHNGLVQQGTLPSTGLLGHNNYLNLLLGSQDQFTPRLVGELVVSASGLHLTQTRNTNLGFALAFPFSSTSMTVTGFETFGDNQFSTPITFFPSERKQEKYQLRYDVSYVHGRHTIEVGVNVIHEPVLGGKFPDSDETLYRLPFDPTYYVTRTAQFTPDLKAHATQSNLGGSFSQNIQRPSGYLQDSWQATRGLTVTYGMHYGTTYGLFDASGRSQLLNPGYLTLAALDIPLVYGPPHDDRRQFAPRLGFAYSPGGHGATVLRGGFGVYFNDLAQTGWASALQAVNTLPRPCTDPVANPGGAENDGCVPGGSGGGLANLIDSRYKTPYAIHFSAGVQHAFGAHWAVSADYIHEQGNHAYRAYHFTGGRNLFTPQMASDNPAQAEVVPDVNVFHSDNRSSYNALLIHAQGEVGERLSLVANYTLAQAQTWGCVLGEIFDYVNGVCDALHPFAKGDYGPSGEDVRGRFVMAGVAHIPLGFQLSGLLQAEGARPFTITTADKSRRISINGIATSLDQFRGIPYVQTDLRLTRPFSVRDWLSVEPFVECFNLLNRNNPGANYVTNLGALPVTDVEIETGNVTTVSASQLRVTAGALGDFFGPGTTIGGPFAAQLGLRISF